MAQSSMVGSQPVAIASDQSAIPITDNNSSLTVDGTTLTSLDNKTPALGQTTMAASTPVVIASNQSAVTIAGTATVSQATGTNLHAVIDSGTVTTITNVVHVDDNAASITVDNPILSVTGGGTEASAQRVTIATDSTGVLSVDDNGASLTIDNAALSVVGNGTSATAQRVTIASDSTGTSVVTQATGSNLHTVIDSGTLSTITNVVHTDDNAGSLTIDNPTLSVTGNGTAATSLRVTIASDTTGAISNINKVASSSTITSVVASTTSVNLLASHTSRRKASFYNDSTASAYLKLGATASTTSFTVRVFPNGLYELMEPCYTGAIDCIWSAANGSMRITEET